MRAQRTIVVFRTRAYNTSAPRPHYLNPTSFGDDVIETMIEKFRELGVETSGKAEQEDYGWYVRFDASGQGHCFVLGFRPLSEGSADGDWIGEVERSCGVIGSMFGRRTRVAQEVTELVHRVVERLPGVSSISWHNERRFRTTDDGGAAHPGVGFS